MSTPEQGNPDTDAAQDGWVEVQGRRAAFAQRLAETSLRDCDPETGEATSFKEEPPERAA